MNFWLILIVALILVYEIVMFVHAFKNPGLSSNRRLLWLIGMVFIHPIVAIAYNLTDYKRANG